MNELQKASENYDDPLECLREMIYSQVCLIKGSRKEIKIYIEEQYQLSTPLRKQALRQQRQLYDIYYNKIGELKSKGLVREIDQTVMTFCISAMMNWAYRWFKDKRRLSIDEVAEDMIKIFFSGILKNP
jgi:hypothetical protein